MKLWLLLGYSTPLELLSCCQKVYQVIQSLLHARSESEEGNIPECHLQVSRVPRFSIAAVTLENDALKKQTMSTKGRTRSDTAADNSSTGPRPTNKRKAKQPVVCPICDESIVDATSHTSGQAAIFCEGLCKEWLHRQCAGLSKAAFDLASQSQDPFFCPQCRLDI